MLVQTQSFETFDFTNPRLPSVERQFEVRDLALARLEGEKERGGEVQVGDFADNISVLEKTIWRDILAMFFQYSFGKTFGRTSY